MPSRARREGQSPAQPRTCASFYQSHHFAEQWKLYLISAGLGWAGLGWAGLGWLQEKRDGAMVGQAATGSTGQVKSGRGKCGAVL